VTSDVTLLSVRGLTIDAGSSQATVRLVEGFDLDIAMGQRLALVGESGSGKTVVARSILRLTKGLRVSGSARFRSTELLTLSEREMRKVRGRQIAMVFQDPMDALNPLMTVGQQITEPLRMTGVTKRDAATRAAGVLSELGVVDAGRRLSAYPHEFSGGMRQRVALAIALVGDPALLIADEPTTALDVRVQEQVLDLLDQVAAERGLAVLMITHDLAAVAGFSDRVTVMYSGRKVHEDDVETLFARPAHPYTAALLAAVPRLDQDHRLEPIPGTPPHPAERPAGCPFHPRCQFATDHCTTTPPEGVALPNGGTVSCHHPLVAAEVARS
jgi:peptide/nickel transport system ATP-binding protein